jgi:hypothetical protein
MIEYRSFTTTSESLDSDLNMLAEDGFILHSMHQVIRPFDPLGCHRDDLSPRWKVVMVREIVDEKQEAEESHPEPMMTKG